MNLSVLGIAAQYTYFYNTYGEFGDQETEVITNVEINGDIIYLFGGIDNDQSPLSFLLKALDNEGNLLFENIVPTYNNETLIGRGWAVSSISPQNFIYTQGVINEGELSAFAVMYDNNLDTIWMKVYNDYAPSTYFRANWDVGNGIIISGNHTPGNQLGTFLMKIDYDGNIVWNKILREPNGKIYYNKNMVLLDDGYLLGGSRTGSDFNAMLTKTDLEGNIVWEYFADNFVDIEGDPADTQEYRVTQLPNGDIVGAHMVWYEYYGTQPWNNQDPSWYRSLHLSKINVEDTSFYWEHDFFTNQEMKGGILWKILPTADNGILAMGTYYGAENTWMLKIDSLGNEEWFNVYNFGEEGYDISHKPYDVEQTSDGGFVVVGQYRVWSIEGLTQSWVMKVDACGDTEWEGCDYVGIQESLQSKQFKLYPNPANTYFQLQGEALSIGDRIEVIDMYGKQVIQEEWTPNGTIDIDELSSGLYQVIVYNKSGSFYSKSLVVE